MKRLKLFGGIAIELDDAPVAGRAVQRRRLALLALLAAARARGGSGGAGVSRDKLIAFLWPTADAENGRRYLSDSVYRINQALNDEVITAAGDELYLDSAVLPSDLVEFQDAMNAADHAAALRLYAGPFLDGFFLSESPELERWIESERSRLAADYARSLEVLGEDASTRGAPALAADCYRRLAAHDPYNSRVALLLMRALRDAGEKAAALQHARIHETLLRQELELDPDPAVTKFVEELRSDTGSHIAAPKASLPAAGPPGAPSLPAALSPPDAGAEAKGRSRRHMVYLAAGAAAALVLAVAVIPARDRGGDTPRRIVVLPFANLSPEPDNEYFSDGMTEELIATLGAIEGVSVASRTSAFAYKNKSTDVREIGRQLGVDAVVEGSVRKSGRALRITARLVSARDGLRLWSDAFDREVDDAVAIQEEIARAIASRITGSLIEQAGGAARPARAKVEAYDLYLRGRYAWHQRTRAGLDQAIAWFDQAVARDSTYARAHVGLADAYAVSAFYDYRAPREAYPRAEAAARKALALDPSLAAPHATLGYVQTYFHLDWARAEEEFRRALAIDPGYSTAHQWYGNLLTVAGRFDEAEREMRLAQEADPLSLIANAALGWSYFLGRRYAAALEQCQRTLALNPDYELAHLWGGWALDELDRREEARAWVDRAVSLSRGSDLTRLALAHVLARSEPPARDSARHIVGALAARGDRGEYVPSYEIAKVYLALGDRAGALRWIERSIEERSHSRAYLRVDPQITTLRGDPEFERLVTRAFSRASTPAS